MKKNFIRLAIASAAIFAAALFFNGATRANAGPATLDPGAISNQWSGLVTIILDSNNVYWLLLPGNPVNPGMAPSVTTIPFGTNAAVSATIGALTVNTATITGGSFGGTNSGTLTGTAVGSTITNSAIWLGAYRLILAPSGTNLWGISGTTTNSFPAIPGRNGS